MQEKTKTPKVSKAIIEKSLVDFFSRRTGDPLPMYIPASFDKQTFNGYAHRGTGCVNRLLWIDEENQTAAEGTHTELVNAFEQALAKFANPEKDYQIYSMTYKAVNDLAKKFLSLGRSVEEWPEPCGFKSQKGLFFQRLDFDPVHGSTREDFPFLAKSLSRMTNSQNFCERIGSMFCPNPNRKQAIWLYGEGDSGKTLWFDLLRYLVGGDRGSASVGDELLSDRFGLYPLRDKILWIGDEVDPKFIRSSLFKIITGDSAVRMNPKGGMQFDVYLKGITFLNSNFAPEIPNDSGLTNRLIVCKTTRVPEAERLTKAQALCKAHKELPQFLGYCIDAYNKLGEGATIIPESTEEIEEGIQSYEAMKAKCFDDLFIEKANVKDGVTINEFRELYDLWATQYKALSKNISYEQFERYAKKRLGKESGRFSPQFRHKKSGIKTGCVPGIIIRADKVRFMKQGF